MQILKDDVRQAILRTAKASFLDKGYDKTSMKELAHDVDISVGNIYRYYPNKEALFLAVIAPTSQALERLIRDHEASGVSPESGHTGLLREIGEVLSQLLLEHREGLLILYYRSEGTPLEKEKEKLIRHLTEHVGEHLRSVPGDVRAAKPIAVAFLEGLFSIIWEYNDPHVVRKVVHQYIDLLFQGFERLL